MDRLHSEVVSMQSRTTFVAACKRSASARISACPLCQGASGYTNEEERDVLIDHIAQHVHSFSLRSLPWPSDKLFEDQVLEDEVIWRVRKWDRQIPLPRSTIEKARHGRDTGAVSNLADYFKDNPYFAEDARDDVFSQAQSSRSENENLEILRAEGPLIFSDDGLANAKMRLETLEALEFGIGTEIGIESVVQKQERNDGKKSIIIFTRTLHSNGQQCPLLFPQTRYQTSAIWKTAQEVNLNGWDGCLDRIKRKTSIESRNCAAQELESGF